MTYVMVRCVERTDEGAFLVAMERLGKLSAALGKVEVVGEIQGCCGSNSPSTLSSLLCL